MVGNRDTHGRALSLALTLALAVALILGRDR